MTARYFEDFKAGERFFSPALTITESAIIDFALQWDPQPFHLDVELAKEWNYGGLIASGLHTMCASLRLWLSLGVFAHCNIGSPGFKNVRFLKPVRPGDTIRVMMELRDPRPSSSKSDRGSIDLYQVTYNQRDEEVITMETTVIVKRRPAATN